MSLLWQTRDILLSLSPNHCIQSACWVDPNTELQRLQSVRHSKCGNSNYRNRSTLLKDFSHPNDKPSHLALFDLLDIMLTWNVLRRVPGHCFWGKKARLLALFGKPVFFDVVCFLLFWLLWRLLPNFPRVFEMWALLVPAFSTCIMESQPHILSLWS